jgi:hypothetical protein
MTGPENFLERWSRKKREAAAAPETPPVAPKATPDVPAPVAALDQGGKPGASPSSPAAPAAPAPTFDPASLPSLESITATTDIRGFFAPGVPPELTRAALRRVWSVDPAIRDFVGLQENDWDFNAPDGIPGFGALPPDFDVKKVVAQIFGEPDNEREAAAARAPAATPPEPQGPAIAEESKSPARSVSVAPPAELAPTRLPTEPAARSETPLEQLPASIVRRENDTALHNESDVHDEQPKGHRRHGRALPK